MDSVKNVVVIVPSYKPDDNLIKTIEGIKEKGFEHFIVVDDGGGEKYSEFFDKAVMIPGCTVLHHAINRGKGAALKTAFSYYTENMNEFDGAVTVDSDGQHMPEDVVKVSQKMLESGKIVLGCRDFSLPEVPARSKFGNKTTSLVFRLFFGMKVGDTQTGLRAFPTKFIPLIASAKGTRYEYETQMLFMIKRAGLTHDEVTIKTVYLDNNSASHFRPIRDSIRIYSLIIKYLIASLASFVVDICIYYILLRILGNGSFLPTAVAAVGARIVSSVFNFTVNAKTVFDGKINRKTALRYFILALSVLTSSTVLVWIFKSVFEVKLPIVQTVVKAITDTLLFVVSFRFQNNWVFGKDFNSEDGGN